MRTTIWMTALVWMGVVAGAGAETAVRVSGVAPGEVGVKGLVVERPGVVEVEAVVAIGELGAMESETWLLDSGTRELVWTAERGRPVSEGRRSKRYREEVRLEAGGYELYYAVRSGAVGDELEAVLADVLGRSRRGNPDLGVSARGAVRPIGEGELARWRERVRAQALVDLAGLGDEAWEERAFVLAAPAEVEVYSLGELGPNRSSDFGWIVDAGTREVVWELTWEGSEPSGGYSENRVARQRLTLPAGRYEARFVTDRGHSASGWYGAPQDPSFWGMTVRCVGGACDASAPVDAGAGPGRLTIGELTGLGDGERRELELTLEEPARLWLYAVSEGTVTMHDRAWIEDSASGEPVWSMDYERTRPAGGSSKNRLADETVVLPAGKYRAVAETDDSHSAGGGWNAEPPAEPERWGLTILVPAGGLVP